MHIRVRLLSLCIASLVTATSANATPFYFSTGDPDGKMAMASRPQSNGLLGIEAADDFVISQNTSLTSATFTGLLTGGATAQDVGAVSVEIYRVFPNDSDTGRTTGAPIFGTTQVPTRVNSPSDVAFDVRDSAANTLNFAVQTLTNSFTADNSVFLGINPKPNQATGGEGSVTGMEVQFDVAFLTPLDLAADHYFFVPQVQLASGDFLWLSSPRPIFPPGTPFAPDLQAWIRNDTLAPDWLRVGTDIVGGSPAPTFNAAFSLSGNVVPEPDSLYLLAGGGVALLAIRRWRYPFRLRT
jgi:hypothetical protein